MLHVNRRDGYTIAVSENKYLTPIAKRSIISDDALGPLIPILEEIVGLTEPAAIRAFFEAHGLQIQEWEKTRTDWTTIRDIPPSADESFALMGSLRSHSDCAVTTPGEQ
jgi:hypothetical protein